MDAVGLMELVNENHGFVLGEKLLDVPKRIQKVFEKAWIEQVKAAGGISKSVLEEALSVGDRDLEELSFADEWEMLMSQLIIPDIEAEMADEWYFTLKIQKIKRTFRFPYCSEALSACNRIIQYCGRR